MRLTPFGKAVVWVIVLAVGYWIAVLPALWWTDNPIAIR